MIYRDFLGVGPEDWGCKITSFETAALKLGQKVAQKAATVWLARRRAKKERSLSLVELAATELTSPIHREKLLHAVTGIAHEVAEQIGSFVEDELDNEVEAALVAVSDAITSVDLSDDKLFGDDVDSEVIARRIRVNITSPIGLSSKANRLYHVVLDQSCRCLVQVILQLPAFESRALANVLGRLSSVAAQLTEVLSRMPRSSLDAPHGIDRDSEFKRRYLDLIATAYDKIELIGVSIRNYRPRTTLSVAYLGLTVDSAGNYRQKPVDWFKESRNQREVGAIRVEGALSGSRRVLLRGEAGSGKTTLLGWVVVTAARAGFTGELAAWNGRAPFVIKLRRFADLQLPRPDEFLNDAEAFGVGPIPQGWAHRMLQNDEALLLVDGVDELTTKQRPAVRRWLDNLLNAYPKVPVIVTSRPGAVNAKWLATERFKSFSLERMAPDDVRTFLGRWHEALLDAAKDADLLPFDQDEIERHRLDLLSKLNARPDLRALASNPLMCSMLCALNLDRGSNLPKDRAGLYNAAMELLLDRRDFYRNIPASDMVGMDYKHKLSLLQSIAWWLTLNGRSELPKDRAQEILTRRLSIMLTCDVEPKAALQHLLERSGVIREPVDNRVDFVHKTFLEFLAAREAMEEDHIDLLVDRAHTDLWRDVVVMAAGLLNRPRRSELISGILDKADRSPKRTSRTLRLLAARCRESLGDLPSEVLGRLDNCIKSLVPPRNRRESRSLATVGESILEVLPANVSNLTIAQARACVQTATLANGPAAVIKLAEYATDHRAQVQESIIASWQYFEPAVYADAVLADAPLIDGRVGLHGTSASVAHVEQLHKLKNLVSLSLIMRSAVDCDVLKFTRPLHSLNLSVPWMRNVQTLSGMTSLVSLSIFCHDKLESVEFLPSADLLALSLGSVQSISDFSFVRSYPNLRKLTFHDSYRLANLDEFGELPNLELLGLLGLDMRRLPTNFCEVLPSIITLRLSASELVDIAPLADSSIVELRLQAPLIRDISPLAGMKELRVVQLMDVGDGLDVTPLMDSSIAHLVIDNSEVYGLESLTNKMEILQVEEPVV